MKRIVSVVLAIGILSVAGFLKAEETTSSVEDRLRALEERNAVLERKVEIDQEAAATKAKEGSGVTASAKDGFLIKSNDGNFALKLGGYIQTDYRDYLKDHGSTQFADQFLERRVRPIISGTVNKIVDFRIMADFANGGGATAGPLSSLLQDAYVEAKPRTWAKFRVGKFKPPVGLERLQSATAITFVERGLPTNLVPNRDTGAQFSGDIKEGVLTYQAGVFNGVVDGTSGETDTHDGKDFAARIFTQPFKLASSDWINGLGVGVAGAIGDQFGSAAASNLTSGYKSDGQQTFFAYQAGTFANGQRKRVVPQASWYIGGLGLLWEYAASSQELRRVSTSTQTATLTNRSWQIAGSYVITGERATYGGVKPRKVFDPKAGGWGALEVTGRYSIFRADDGAFENGGFFANPATSAKLARAWTTGFNWYFNNNLKLTSNYDVTSFVGGAAAGQNRPTERVVLSRVQVSF